MSLYTALQWLLHMMQEYMRKEVEHAKTAAELQESYAATCRKMGIEVCLTAGIYCPT